jgi:biopolymer transport protein ExbD
MKLPRRTSKRGRVEIIPMIDTILILLIFYMSFSTFAAKEKRIDSRLPVIAKASSQAPTEVPMDLTIHVHDLDHMLVNGAPVESAYLRTAMMQMGSTGQKATIVIEAEPETSYQAVINALDACAQAHMTNVAFRPLSDKAPDKAPEK